MLSVSTYFGRGYAVDLELANKVVLVTAGSGDGVGSAVARRYAAEGAKVAITYRSRPKVADRVADEVESLGGQALPVFYDLADHDSIRAAVATVSERWGGIDVLVANASSGPASAGAAIEDVPDEAWQTKLRTDVEGTYLTLRTVAPVMKRRGGGRIVLVSSTGWEHGRAGDRPYEAVSGAAKSALIGLARSLAVELGHEEILVNVVSPGAIRSPLLDQFLGEAGVRALAGTAASGKVSTADDIAAGIVFLGSFANGNTTGATLPVDGGV